jgi:hypothetical protein
VAAIEPPAGSEAGPDWDWEGQQRFFQDRFGAPLPDPTPELWPRRQYDPSPAAGDDRSRELVLPMPCGGAMVFVRVEVATDGGWLGEQTVELGNADNAHAPVDSLRLAHVAGAFTAGAVPANRHYYLGKYEVTELQYRVVTPPCPERLAGRRPAVNLSWFDAVEFTRRYTEWLHRNAPDRLPQEDGMRGFLRLPTEVEWEFAARGGLEVDPVGFRARVFPTDGSPIEDYSWIRESVASSFEPRPVGSLKPNPLGLHDILGNAAELVFDLFRLSARGRLHAQPGGYLVKGGHYRSWRRSLSSAWRQEHPHFNPVNGEPNRLDTVGMRVAISAPVVTSEQRLQTLRQAWDALPPTAPAAELIRRCSDLAGEVAASMSALSQRLDRCLDQAEPPSPPAGDPRPEDPQATAPPADDGAR